MPDLSKARLLFHHRDPALDEAWGEGSEITLRALPDGRLYLESYRYHVDWDGRHDDRFVSEEEAIEAVASHGGGDAVGRLFPDSKAARWQARYGECRRSSLDRHYLDAIVGDAEVVFRAEAAEELTVWAHPDGLWVVEDVHAVSKRPYRRLARPREALGALRKAGCPGALLRRLFPDSPVVRLMDRLGVSEWDQAEREHLPGLAATSLHLASLDAGEEGVLSVWRVDPELFLARRQREDRVTFNALDPLHAAQLLAGMGLEPETWRLAFPDGPGRDEVLARLLRQAGLSFPAADPSAQGR